jgi:hypothetical protein
MSGLLLPYNFPATQAGGTEGLGVGVNTATLLTVAPNGTVGTQAQIQADIAAVLAAGGQNVFGLQGNIK